MFLWAADFGQNMEVFIAFSRQPVGDVRRWCCRCVWTISCRSSMCWTSCPVLQTHVILLSVIITVLSLIANRNLEIVFENNFKNIFKQACRELSLTFHNKIHFHGLDLKSQQSDHFWKLLLLLCCTCGP